MRTVSGNVGKSYFYIFLSSFSPTEAIWMLYLAWRGMSLVEIGLLEGIFHATSLLMEVPTGIIADRFGRRTSRALSRFVAFAATVMMIASRDFPTFALAFVLTALGYNLESGAGDALIYDSLVDLGRDGDFMKVKGRQEVFYQAAHGISIMLGGFVATWSYELAYAIAAALHLGSLALALGFAEPHSGRNNAERGKQGIAGAFASLGRHIGESITVIRAGKGVMAYILFIEGFSLLYTTLFFYFQNFLKSRNWVEWQIGLVLAASASASALLATVTHRVEVALGRMRLISLAPFAAILCLGLIAFSGLEAWAMVALSALEGLLFVSFSDYINRLIPSENRATLLSFQAMVFSSMMIVFFPLIGGLAQEAGFKTAFAAICAVSIFLLLGARRTLLRHLAKVGDDFTEKSPARIGEDPAS